MNLDEALENTIKGTLGNLDNRSIHIKMLEVSQYTTTSTILTTTISVTEIPKNLEEAVFRIIKEIYENMYDDLLYIEFIKVYKHSRKTIASSTTSVNTGTSTTTKTLKFYLRLKKIIFE